MDLHGTCHLLGNLEAINFILVYKQMKTPQTYLKYSLW